MMIQVETAAKAEALARQVIKDGHSVLLVSEQHYWSGALQFARLVAAMSPPLAGHDLTVAAWARFGSRLADDVSAWDTKPPFRAPHYTCSAAAITGTATRPGEATLAHGGVLYLDEADQFRTHVLDALNIALQNGESHGLPVRPRNLIGSVHCETGDETRLFRLGSRLGGLFSNYPVRFSLPASESRELGLLSARAWGIKQPSKLTEQKADHV